jgi:hypothetical protein
MVCSRKRFVRIRCVESLDGTALRRGDEAPSKRGYVVALLHQFINLCAGVVVVKGHQSNGLRGTCRCQSYSPWRPLQLVPGDGGMEIALLGSRTVIMGGMLQRMVPSSSLNPIQSSAKMLVVSR